VGSSGSRVTLGSFPRAGVSLILTVRNEAEQLPELLASIERQTLPPHEVIAVDGGSEDGTVELLGSWCDRLPLVVLEAPGASISQGRNLALRRATGEVIAVVDAGVRLDERWLEEVVAPLQQEMFVVDAVGGFFRPAPRTDFERALAATTLPEAGEIDPATFLPSSRSFAFRSSWIDAGIRYPEWLDYCEDLIFDLRLKRAGATFLFRPQALVWFRPRPTAVAFWHQYFRYARGDGKAGLFSRRHLVRYLTYLVVLPSLLVVRSPWWRALVAAGALWYVWRPAKRLRQRHPEVSPPRLLRLAGLAVALRLVGDVAKMVGYPVGLVWRARRYGLRRDWRTIPERRWPGALSVDAGQAVGEVDQEELARPERGATADLER
jgi:glycosyltransferase involved in cell wall biosynthesis